MDDYVCVETTQQTPPEEVCWPDLLPDEAMFAIFSHLHPRYSNRLRLVCSNWQRLADDNLLWKEWSQQRWDYIHPVQERAGAWKTYYRERSCLYQLLILVYNRTHIVRVSRYDTVDDIMVILEAELGLTGTLYMDMMGKSLSLGVPLGDFGIRNGTRLHLKARLNAPPAPPTIPVPAPAPVPVPVVLAPVPTPPAGQALLPLGPRGRKAKRKLSHT